jgi:hypothetical protein
MIVEYALSAGIGFGDSLAASAFYDFLKMS